MRNVYKIILVIQNYKKTDTPNQTLLSLDLLKIQYGIDGYGQAANTQTRKVKYNKTAYSKCTYNKDFKLFTTQLHKDLNLLLVKDIHNISIASFIYTQKQSLLPTVFKNHLRHTSDVHHHKTKQQQTVFRMKMV